MKKLTKRILVSLLAVLQLFTFSSLAFAYTLDSNVAISNYNSTGNSFTLNGSTVNSVASSLTWTKDTSQNLFYSNNPETVDGTSSGILYQDSTINSKGKFRVFWSHRNNYPGNTATNAYIGMAIYNNTGKTISIKFGKRGYGTSTTGKLSGGTALKNWLASSSTEYTYTTINNGTYSYVGFLTKAGEVTTGMYDVIIRDTAGALVTGGVTVKTYVTRDVNGNPATVLATNRIYPLDTSGTNGDARASLTYATKTLSWQAATNQMFGFTSSVYPNWPVPANDIDTGIDKISGLSVRTHGSYGMDLKITATVPSNSAILYIPDWEQGTAIAGGNHYFAASVTGRGVVDKLVGGIPYGYGWVLKTNPTAGSVTIQTGMPSFDSAPLHLAVVQNV